jgi:peptidoglycan/xylan/chitin deacetylase (PgdA/CDA1 family)/CelD/BcsL family acetyltransferase involved in cellulose biosynthesis
MKVIAIQQESELAELRAEWDELLSRSATSTIFLTWEWAAAWWSAYGKPGELWVLTAWDDAGKLVGIAPLRRQIVNRYGQRYEAISFLGDGSADSDYLDFLIASGHEPAVMEAFHKHWGEELARGAVLLLNEIPESSPNLSWLRHLAESRKMIWSETDVPCGAVRLPESWEKYLGLLRPRFRTKVRSMLRALEERPDVRFGFCEDAEQVRRMLPVLFDLHARRWAEEAKPGVFRWDRKRDFYVALSAKLLEREWLRFSWLEWKGQVLACQYGFAYQGTYCQLQEGYEPASEHWNSGIGLRAWTIREFIKEGLTEYDFLGGIGRHKSDWGAETKQSKRVLFADQSWKNQLLCHGPEWAARARGCLNKIVPGWLLAARNARRPEPQNTAPDQNQDMPEKSAPGWMRTAGANCYFYFGLPGVVRRFRDQYQLSVSNGNGPRISCHRRSEASARILYYHRVNDEGDPFFPALSTAVFNQQMRFVARHYKVVTLGELLTHLESESTEPVVAITFDDGYQDNYQNAFPILQRYGLPATIFLTTGSMDSRDPLWFEQLALALKKTTREFIDLEIDLPRRLRTRSTAERLQANARIFALLRVLPEGDRQRWLADILDKLAVQPDQERRDKMLTWEQVRLMKKHAIDFGSHTVSHPFISKLPREQVKWELVESKKRIEEELQSPVQYFAYPNGRDEDIGAWNKELLRDAGYRAALTTIWGVNYRSTDLMELRRGGPWEEVMALFAYKMDWYQLVDS